MLFDALMMPLFDTIVPVVVVCCCSCRYDFIDVVYAAFPGDVHIPIYYGVWLNVTDYGYPLFDLLLLFIVVIQPVKRLHCCWRCRCCCYLVACSHCWWRRTVNVVDCRTGMNICDYDCCPLWRHIDAGGYPIVAVGFMTLLFHLVVVDANLLLLCWWRASCCWYWPVVAVVTICCWLPVHYSVDGRWVVICC